MSPNANTLTIEFTGIGTHFHHNILPGIAHRVVLPDCTGIKPGLLIPGWETDPKRSARQYLLMPHIPQIRLNVDGEWDPEWFAAKATGYVGPHGILYTPSRLTVLNALGDHVSYDASFEKDGYKLTTYVYDYTYATDVVLGGRASAYFDLHSGNVSTVVLPPPDGAPSSPDQATKAVARLTTDGPPQIRFEPFDVRPTLDKHGHIVDVYPEPLVVTLESDPPGTDWLISFGNHDVLPGVSDLLATYGGDDFLLHYLTATGGIPNWIKERPPGMPPAPADPQILEDVVSRLIGAGYLRGHVPSILVSSDPSCSPTQYP